MKTLKTIIFILFFSVSNLAFAATETNDSNILRISEVTDEGLSLHLNDGSEWDIHYFGGLWKLLGWGWVEEYDIAHWTAGDIIAIEYPSDGNFIDFVLIVNNFTRNEVAVATLRTPPLADQSASLFVTRIDETTGQITLNDGSVWEKTTTNLNGPFFGKSPAVIGTWECGDALTLIRGTCSWSKWFLWNHSTNELLLMKKIQ
jgi:hypothetical protein